MNEQVFEKKYTFINKVAVLSLAVLIYTTSLTTPILGTIAKSFPDVSLNTIKLIPTLPSLVMVVVSLLVGQLERFFTKKQMLYIAMAFLCIGIIPAFYGGITLIIITRVFIGVSFGILFPLAGAIIAQLFEGKERNSMMGYRIGVGAFFGVVFQTYGGMVGVINWRFAFLGFLVIIPVALLIIFKLPEPNMKPVVNTEKSTKEKLKAKTYMIAILNLLYTACVFTFMTNVAIVMSQESIGNPAQAGFVLTMFSAGSFVTSMLYGKIYQLLKKYCMAVAILLIGCGFLILLKGTSYSWFLFGGIIFGMGFGLGQADFITKIVGSATKATATSAMGIMTCFGGLGSFASPYILTFATGLFGLTGTRAPWVVTSISFLVSCVIYIIVVTVPKKKVSIEGNL